MIIYRKTDGIETVVCQLSDKNAKLAQERMGRDEVGISVTVDEILPIRELDYIRVEGEIYTLNRFTDYDENSDVEYRYNLLFEGVSYNLMDKMYVNPLNNSDKFPLTESLRGFAELLVSNINESDPGWTLGEVPETELKNITFESVTCREVPNKLADEFNVEYYFKGRQLNFVEKFENKTSLVFERGKGKGLYKVTCKNADTGNTVTRVRVYGSTENLPVGYRNNQVDRLQLPMTDGQPTPYLEDYSEFKKMVEKTVHFDDVKPSFTGVAGSVSDEYNRRIICPEIDFDLKAVAVGDDARINFLTGDLTGVSFRFQWDNSKKEINLVRQEDEMELPDAENKRPLIPHDLKKAVAGDKFNFTGINLPESYVVRAENELLRRGRDWLSYYKQLRVTFGLEVDHRHLKETGATLHIGDVVTIRVPKLKIEKLLRILSIEKDLYTGKVKCTVSNYVVESWEKKIEGQIQNTQSNIDNIASEANYLVEASKEWVAKRFARLFGGNNFIGNQSVDGDVEIAEGRRFSLGSVVICVLKNLFQTVLSITGKDGEDIKIQVAGVEVKKVTADEISTPGFVSGMLGSGSRLKDDHLEVDEITVRKRMNVRELMIEMVKSIGGILIVSAGAMKTTAVEDGGSYFKCLFDNGGGTIENPFVVDDQVLCQTFSGSKIKRYWRRVTSVGADYFNLSKTDCETGSADPEAGDEVVQLGNRTDATRQSASILCAVGADAPYYDNYSGINSFDLSGKLVTREGNLTGIVDEVFGQLSDSGLYGKNVYLRGRLALASGKTVDSALSEVDTKSENAKSTAESAQQVANNAAGEVSKTNAELTKVTNNVQLLADAQTGFSVSVSEVREKVDNLQIGGVNIYVDGLGTSDFTITSVPGAGYTTREFLDFSAENKKRLRGKYLTVSFDYELVEAKLLGVAGFEFLIKYSDGATTAVVADVKTIYPNKISVSGRYAKTIKLENKEIDGVVTWQPYFFINTSEGVAKVGRPAFYIGEKDLGWVENPDLLKKQIEAIAQAKADLAEKQAKAHADGIVTKAEQAAIDEAQRRLDALQIGGVNYLNSPRNIAHAGNMHNEIYIDKDFLSSYNRRDEFVLSFFATAVNFTSSSRSELFVMLSNDSSVFRVQVPIDFVGTYTNKRFEIKFQTNGSQYKNIDIAYIITLGSVTSLSLSDIMIEPGNKASASWFPSLTEQKAEIEKVSDIAKQAKEQAEAAQNQLSDWGSDSKISPTEKTGLKQQLADIQSERNQINSDVIRLNLSGEIAWINYSSAYGSAIAALNKYSVSFPETIDIDTDYADIAAYYQKRQEILDLVSANISDSKKVTVIDTSLLDQNTYYPVTMLADVGKRSSFQVKTILGKSGVPAWATHFLGFSCECSWEANGNGYGTIPINRYIDSFTHSFAVAVPIGDIDQMANSSNEYIYVRGGGIYTFTTTNTQTPVLRISDFTINDQIISPRKSVTAPKVDVDAVRTELTTAINQTKELIELRATKEEFNAVGERVSIAEGRITAQAGDISAFVKKDDLISEINLRPEGIRINANKIEITGATVFRDGGGNVVNIFGSGTDVFNINNAFKVDKYGKATMRGAEVEGKIVATSGEFTGKIQSSLNGNRIEIDPDKRMLSFVNSSNITVGSFIFNNSYSEFKLQYNSNVYSYLTYNTLRVYNGGFKFEALANMLIHNNLPRGRTGDGHIQVLPSGAIFIDTGQDSNNTGMLRIKY